MPRLIWAPSALEDVQRLYRFLASTHVDSARRAAKAIRAGVKILANQPQLGRPVDDLDIRFREWLIEFGDTGYAALYRVESDAVVILVVRHQKEVGYS